MNKKVSNMHYFKNLVANTEKYLVALALALPLIFLSTSASAYSSYENSCGYNTSKMCSTKAKSPARVKKNKAVKKQPVAKKTATKPRAKATQAVNRHSPRPATYRLTKKAQTKRRYRQGANNITEIQFNPVIEIKGQQDKCCRSDNDQVAKLKRKIRRLERRLEKMQSEPVVAAQKVVQSQEQEEQTESSSEEGSGGLWLGLIGGYGRVGFESTEDPELNTVGVSEEFGPFIGIRGMITSDGGLGLGLGVTSNRSIMIDLNFKIN